MIIQKKMDPFLIDAKEAKNNIDFWIILILGYILNIQVNINRQTPQKWANELLSDDV